MERKYQKLNLDPMYFWQFVMKGSEDRLSCVLIKGNIPENLVEVIEHNPYVSWIVEDGEEVPSLKNVLYRERKRLTDKEWVKGWSSIDYLVCDEEDAEYWMVAGLCGTSVKFGWNENIDIKVLSKVERIENWEWARSVLTKK